MPTMNTRKPSNFPDPPTFEEAIKKLRSILLDRIVEALLEGTLHVSEYSHGQAEPIDAALAPNLVRHKAKRHLVEHGQQTEDEEEEDRKQFAVEYVSNNGLYTLVPGFRVRILKSGEDGSVPPPGVSEARRNFYNQLQSLIDFAEWRNEEGRVEPDWNLIVHWTVDKQYNLLKISIALPLRFEKAENGRWEVECSFDEPFWIGKAQAGVISIQSTPVEPPSSLDLPIEEETKEKAGEEPEKE